MDEFCTNSPESVPSMSEAIVLLEHLHDQGQWAAQKNFESFMECAEKSIPAPLRGNFPKTLADIAGLFTASTTHMSLSLLDGIPGYDPVTVGFDKVDERWKFTEFFVYIGAFVQPYKARALEDAVVMSRKLASLRAMDSGQQIIGFPNPKVQ